MAQLSSVDVDDQTRLLRLLSLVFKSKGNNKVSLRFVDDGQEQRWHDAARSPLHSDLHAYQRGQHPEGRAATALHMVLSHWDGALRDYNATGNHQTPDADQLPEFALEAIDQLTGEMRIELGRMIQRSLGMFHADNKRLVELWVDDVARTSWRLLVLRQELDKMSD